MKPTVPTAPHQISLGRGIDPAPLSATAPIDFRAPPKRPTNSHQRTPLRNHKPDRFMRRPEVQHATGLSRSSVYRLLDAKDFPAPIRLSLNTVAWLESEVQAWIEDRVAASRKAEELKPSTPARG